MEVGKRFGRAAKSSVAIALATAFFIAAAGERSDLSVSAHKPITSKYDYNKDVFPLLQAHCARCHVEGGPAPMSLMTYKDAVPWAESIREELTARRMPPWPLDPTSPAVTGGYPINSRDLDKIVVWASGGTPQGDPAASLPTQTFHPQWILGPPDVKLPVAEHTLPAGMMEDTTDVSLSIDMKTARWIKAADLMPGTASIVRDAVISIENGPVLSLWLPGADHTVPPNDAAFRLTPGSKIRVQIHYKKHFDQEQNSLSDKSTVGLYFTDPPSSGRELQSFAVDGAQVAGDRNGSFSLANTLLQDSRVFAVRPMLDRAYTALQVDAITPSGDSVPLLHLDGPRPQWLRRYWLQNPVQLPSGSKIQVRATPLVDESDEPKIARHLPLQVILDYVQQ